MMSEIIKALLVIAASYTLGSLSWALIIGKVGYGVDLREKGSKNPGATNAFRVLGPLAGFLILIGDVSKGIISVLLASYLFPNAPTLLQSPVIFSNLDATVVVLAGLAAIIGHNWSIYFNFTGGKGISTSAGVLLILVPRVVLILLVVWSLIFIFTRIISLGSVTIAALFPFLAFCYYPNNYPYLAFSLVAAGVAIYKHRSNIKRL
ncbi:MAG: glycerol-3-phosphate 1-O-acyltransferase PlsY, partial [Candidatus Subteraquimicrobiales bacterium]|nr:glycerol-3-phosphate 1-O-acyltransferase PlsY [Candidatus Subteraquimicrobiales bacterium]